MLTPFSEMDVGIPFMLFMLVNQSEMEGQDLAAFSLIHFAVSYLRIFSL